MTKAQKNPYAAGAKPTPCPILVDPVQDKPTRYVLAVHDPRSPNAAIQASGLKSYSPLLQAKPGILIKLAAIWHYLKLRESSPPEESVKLIGWTGPRDATGIPVVAWITPSQAKSQISRESWIRAMDKNIAGIQRLDEWLFAMNSNLIKSVDYFAHGEIGFLVMGDDRTDIEKIPTLPQVFTNRIKKTLANCSCGKFLDDAEIRLFSCEAGMHRNRKLSNPNDVDSLSVAAALAQVFNIRTFGSPYILSLRPALENQTLPFAFFVKNQYEDEFIKKTTPEEGRKPTKREPENPKDKPEEQFYKALWWSFLPFEIPDYETAYKDWEGTCELASKNTSRSSLEKFGRTAPLDSPFPEHFHPPSGFKAKEHE